jgi:hypothetical protein
MGTGQLAGATRLGAGSAHRSVRAAKDRKERPLFGSRQQGERPLLHGEIASARGPRELEPARGWLGQALALSDELGMRPLACRCRLVLGALDLEAGRQHEAHAWLAPTVTDLQAMGISRWLARAERLLVEASQQS